MQNEKVVLLIEMKVPSHNRIGILESIYQYLPLVRAEPGVEAFYTTAREDDPGALVFFEVYASQAALDFHLQQEYTKQFLATLNSKIVGEKVKTKLIEVGPK